MRIIFISGTRGIAPCPRPARQRVQWLSMSFARFLCLLPLLAALAAAPAHGQGTLEIIPLRHRTAEQVLPALRLLLEPGATLTGHGTQLIVRTSPSNLAELRHVLEAIDRPARRLQISVRFDQTLDESSRSIEAGGRISNRGARIDLRADERSASAADRVDQRIQVLEGGRAYVATGQSMPILHGAAIQEAATGFDVVPRLAGDTVLVDIVQRRETQARQQGLATTVSARLGEWFEVGSAVQAAQRDERGLIARGTGASLEMQRVWLKVDELR
jgi:hypothetical protein